MGRWEVDGQWSWQRVWRGGQGRRSCFTVVCSSRFKIPSRHEQWRLHTDIPAWWSTGTISKAQVVEPTQGCPPSPAQLLPSCPALALDQRQAARRGTGLMMAQAMPSLSRPNPRVQFWLMLFPADKMQTSSFYLFFLIRRWGGEGRVRALVKYVIESMLCFIISWLAAAELY